MEQHRAEPELRLLPRRGWTRSASASRTSTPIGAWRDQDGTFPIDPSGMLPGGQSFQGPAELKAILQGEGRSSSPAA